MASRNGESPDVPPKFIIDLSLAPELRYVDVCASLSSHIAALPSLFDEVVAQLLPGVPLRLVHWLSRMFLRRVYDDEETRELKGIGQATGVDMYLLVAFNVLLDLFMGCSSGGAAVRDDDAGNGLTTTMVHFRTLDWDMPALRKVVIRLDFVLKKGGPVVASSVTYAGFVGALTGVRRGLSMSLNFRPTRANKGVWQEDAKYAWHLGCVLLGRRRSISSHLRQFLVPKGQARHHRSKWGGASYRDVVARVTGIRRHETGDQGTATKIERLQSTACYLTFSDGDETTVIEKDRIESRMRSDRKFIVVTNCDASDKTYQPRLLPPGRLEIVDPAATMDAIISEAEDRAWHARMNWREREMERRIQSREMETREKEAEETSGILEEMKKEETRSVVHTMADVIWMMQQYPTANECTHYACIMDAKRGTIEWCRRWRQPMQAPSESAIARRFCTLDDLARIADYSLYR